jgi:glutamyl-tRNA(Gln) amidotransferase subunit E
LDDVRRLGPEFAYHVRVRTGLKGLFHSDELPDYGITSEEFSSVNSRLRTEASRDGFVIVCAEEATAIEALRAVYERAREAIDGVPSEVRRPLQDGSSEYMRPMPGSARMYPETDIPPIPITNKDLEEARGMLPEDPERRIERMGRELGLSQETLNQLVNLELLDDMEDLCSGHADPRLASLLLLQGFPKARERGLDPSSAPKDVLLRVLDEVIKGSFAKEAIPEVLCQVLERILSKRSEGRIQDPRIMGTDELEEILTRASSGRGAESEMRDLARRLATEKHDLIMERGENAVGPLMGLIMKEFRGKVDGAVVSRVMREEVLRVLGGGK